jgi:hypothetical protein
MSLKHTGVDAERTEALAIAATGVSAGFAERLFSAGMPARIGEAVWGPQPEHGRRQEWRRPQWLQYHAAIERHQQSDWTLGEGNIIEGALVNRRGSIVVYRMAGPSRHEDRGPEPFTESELRERFSKVLAGARNVLLDLGAHGDLRLAYTLHTSGRNMFFDEQPQKPWGRDLPHMIPVSLWTDFDEDVTDQVFAEVARASGIGPLAPGEFA